MSIAEELTRSLAKILIRANRLETRDEVSARTPLDPRYEALLDRMWEGVSDAFANDEAHYEARKKLFESLCGKEDLTDALLYALNRAFEGDPISREQLFIAIVDLSSLVGLGSLKKTAGGRLGAIVRKQRLTQCDRVGQSPGARLTPLLDRAYGRVEAECRARDPGWKSVLEEARQLIPESDPMHRRITKHYVQSYLRNRKKNG